MSETVAAVGIRGITKRFGDVTAVDAIDLDIADGEFFAMLGPSGCGKTTTLRMIAGLEFPTEGSLKIFGDEVGTLPPNKRPVNTVFQAYALFPHMTVAENVAFGLKMQKVPKAEIAPRVAEAIASVQLGGMEHRKPSQLSGGQQQRVALARALVNKPKVLLLDEPLGALDLKLRQEMQTELKALQREVGITFVFVTHDQEEALTMSDRIAVMSAGKIQQIGAPLEIYEQPLNRFVADFIGDSNFLEATIDRVSKGQARCSTAGKLKFDTPVVDGHGKGDRVTLAVRPERISLTKATARSASAFSIAGTTYLGTDTAYEIPLGDGASLTVRDQNTEAGMGRFQAGDKVKLGFSEGAARMLVD